MASIPRVPRRTGEDIEFISLLRAVACLMVVYCHLVGFQYGRLSPGWRPGVYVDAYLVRPLGIIWYFGFLGVAIFFIVSGFIMCHAAQRDTRWSFSIKRALRIYPPFLVAFCIALLLEAPKDMALADILMAATLFPPRHVVLAISWTLAIEVVFYVLIGLMLGLVQRRPIFATLATAALPAVLIPLAHRWSVQHGEPLVAQYALILQFIPVFAIGMAAYYKWANRIGLRAFVCLVAASWISLIFVANRANLTLVTSGASFATQIAYAAAIFGAALWAGPSLRLGRVAQWLSKTSYSIYLLHGPLGGATLLMATPRIGYTGALMIALMVVGLGSWLSWSLVEEPSRKLARVILNGRSVGVPLEAAASEANS